MMKNPWKNYFLVAIVIVFSFQILLADPVFATSPQPPANVTVSDGIYPDKIEIAWSGSSGATSYDIYRADSPVSMGGSIAKIGTTSATLYDDTSALCDNIYFYWVKANNADGSSKYSIFDSGYCMGSASFSLALAVDNTDLSFETGGSADWFWENARHYKMQDAAESGNIQDNQESWMQTTVNGSGTLAFYWKVSSHTDADFLEFYIDDTKTDAISGTVQWTLKQLKVLPGSHTFKWRFAKNEQFSGGLDCGWVDFVKWTPDSVVSYSNPPTTPAGVSASDGMYIDKIRITWIASSSATSYKVYRADSFEGSKTEIGTTTKTFFDDTADLPCGTKYQFYYWVKAVNSSGASDLFYSDLGYKNCSNTSQAASQTADDSSNNPTDIQTTDIADEPDFLDPPDNVFATDGIYPEKVRIDWEPVSGATSYEVYRHFDCCGARTKIGTTSDTFFEDREVLSKLINYYWVKAVNSNTTSYYSNYNTGYKLQIPRPPINVNASDGTYVSRIHVTWSPYQRPKTPLTCDNTCGGDEMIEKVSEYEVYRSEWSGGAKTKIGTTTDTWFDDYDIPCDSCGYSYYYWIVAKNAAGSSQYSNYDSGYAYRTLRDPYDIRATDGTIHFCVRITWTHIAGAVSYNIFRSESLDGVKTKIGSISIPPCKPCSLSYLDTTPICPEIYYYWVQSVDKNGISSCKFLYYDTGFCSGD